MESGAAIPISGHEVNAMADQELHDAGEPLLHGEEEGSRPFARHCVYVTAFLQTHTANVKSVS